MPSARLKTEFRGYGPGRVDMPDSVYLAASRKGLILRSGEGEDQEAPSGLTPAPQVPDQGSPQPPEAGGTAPTAIDWEQAGLTKDQRQALTDAGMDDPELLRAAEDGDILALPHIGPAALKRIRETLGE